MPKPDGSRTIDSDSDSNDDCIGLPGDKDDDDDDGGGGDCTGSTTTPAAQQAVGFDIGTDGFGEDGAKGTKRKQKRPPKGLTERLSKKCSSTEKVSGDRDNERAEAEKEREREKRRIVAEKKRQRQKQAAAAEGKKKEAPIGVNTGIEEPSKPLSPPAELPPEMCNVLRDHIALFGGGLVQYLRSSRWQHRSEGILELQNTLHSYPSGKHKPKVFTLVAAHLAWSIADSVFQVFACTAGMVEFLLKSYVNDLSPSVVQSCFAPLIPALVDRLADCNGRVRDIASELLLSMARHRCLGVAFTVSFAEDDGDMSKSMEGPAIDTSEQPKVRNASSSSWKLMIGKINLLSALVQEHPFADSSTSTPTALSLESVMHQAVEGLLIVNPKVRKTATALVVEVYKKVGKAAERHLQGVPASILRQLKQEIEIEVCDAAALRDADVKEQEEEDMAVLEPDLLATLPAEQKEILKSWTALLQTDSLVCLFSKKWKLRDRVFGRLKTRLEEALSHLGTHPNDPEPTGLYQPGNYQVTRAAFEALVQVAEMGVQDNIPQLVCSCIAFLKPLLQLYGSIVAAKDLRWHFGNVIISRLIAHVSGTTSVVTQASLSMLKEFARHPKLGVAFISNIVMQPDHARSGQNWKMMLARLTILKEFVEAFEFNEDGLSTEAVMGYAVSSFQSPNGKVRSGAVEVIIEVYKKCGNVIRVHLRNQRPALLNDLKEKIAKVARKDRTKSAPIQTLAGLVQPLDVEDGLEKVLPTRPSTFPAALDAEGELPDPSLSVRARVSKWKEEKAVEAKRAEEQQNHVVEKQPQRDLLAASTIVETGSPQDASIQAPPPPSSSSRRWQPPGQPIHHTSSSDCILPPRHGQSRLVLG